MIPWKYWAEGEECKGCNLMIPPQSTLTVSTGSFPDCPPTQKQKPVWDAIAMYTRDRRCRTGAPSRGGGPSSPRASCGLPAVAVWKEWGRCWMKPLQLWNAMQVNNQTLEIAWGWSFSEGISEGPRGGERKPSIKIPRRAMWREENQI